jgi:hypothetical protein
LRQDGSRAPTRSAGIAAEAVIVFSFAFFPTPSNSMPGMNEWLTIRSLGLVFCKQLLIGRCDVSHGSSGIRHLTPWRCAAQATKSGRSSFWSDCDFIVAPAWIKQAATSSPNRRRTFSFCRGQFHSGTLLPIVSVNGTFVGKEHEG